MYFLGKPPVFFKSPRIAALLCRISSPCDIPAADILTDPRRKSPSAIKAVHRVKPNTAFVNYITFGEKVQ